MTVTVVRVSPNPEKPVSTEDQKRIRDAMQARDQAEDRVRVAVLTAKDNGAGMRPLQAFTGISTNTISRWNRERKAKGQS